MFYYLIKKSNAEKYDLKHTIDRIDVYLELDYYNKPKKNWQNQKKII